MNLKNTLIFFVSIFAATQTFCMETETTSPKTGTSNIEARLHSLESEISTIREYLKTDHFLQSLDLDDFKKFVSYWAQKIFSAVAPELDFSPRYKTLALKEDMSFVTELNFYCGKKRLQQLPGKEKRIIRSAFILEENVSNTSKDWSSESADKKISHEEEYAILEAFKFLAKLEKDDPVDSMKVLYTDPFTTALMDMQKITSEAIFALKNR